MQLTLSKVFQIISFKSNDLSKIEKYKNYLLVHSKEVNSNNMAV